MSLPQSSRSPRPVLTASIASILLASLFGPCATGYSATLNWDGGGGDLDLGTATNWNPDQVPSVAVPDILQWNGAVAGPLSLLYSNAALVGAAGNAGANLSILGTQTGSLNIDTGTNTNAFRMNNVTIESGAGAFSLGNGANIFNINLGGAAGTRTWTNNSANTATVGSDVVFNNGGGGVHTFVTAGAGNWTFNGSLTPANINGTTVGIIVNRTGTGTTQINGASTIIGLRQNGGTIVVNGNTTTGAFSSVGVVAGDNATLSAIGTASFTAAGTDFNAGDVGTARGRVNWDSTGTLTVGTLYVGKGQGSVGVFNQTAGTVTNSGGGEWRLGGTGGGTVNDYGIYNQSGGAVNITSNFQIGYTGAGVYNMTGGTLTASGWLSPARQNATSQGLLDISGGTLTHNGGTATTILVGEQGKGVLNLSGTGTLVANSSRGEGSLRLSSSAAAQGIANIMAGGTLVTRNITDGGGASFLYLNGGTVKPVAATASFINGLDNAVVGPNGAVFDTNNLAITIPQVLAAPAGSGITNIAVTSGGSGYVGEPVVNITGGGGTGATAKAIVSNGVLTGFVITNPGINYTSVPTISLTGGGASVAAILGTPSIGANATQGGLTKTGAGVLTLTASNTYMGPTSVNNGTLEIVDGGSINNSSGIAINGANAKFLQRGFVTVTPQVTLTNGTVDGTGMIQAVMVGDGTGGTITNGNGTAAQLTINALTFNGAADILARVNDPFTPALSVGTLTTGAQNAAGLVTIDAVPATGLWTNGQTYTLINYLSMGGQGFAGFEKGDIAGLSSRQSATLSDTGSAITLGIAGDFPVWTGALDGRWTTASLPEPKNWKLQTGGTSTDFISGDVVIFNDDATGNAPIDISDADVSVTTATFSANGRNYTVMSSGGFGISGGSVTKSGAGSLTIATANSYAGGTTLNAGTLNLNNASALGTGALSIAGGTIDNTSGEPITLSTNNAQSWTGGFTFAGTNPLNLGTGSVTLGADSATETLTISNNSALAGDSLVIGGAVTSANGGTPGVKTLFLTGTGATAFTGNITSGSAAGLVIDTVLTGKLTLSGAASAITTLSMNGGGASVVDLGNGNLTLANGGGNILQATGGGSIVSSGGSIVIGSANGDFGTAAGTVLNVEAPIAGTNAVDFYSPNGNLGTIVLAAANTNTGGANVQNTKVIIPATGAINANNVANSGQVNVGNAGGLPAELELHGGTINATRTAAPSFAVGIANGAMGTVTMTAGAINATGEFWLSNGLGGQAVMNMSGGQVSSGSWLVVGRDRGTGTLNLSNGTVTKGATGGYLIIGSLGGAGTVTQTGGALNASSNGIRIGENSGNFPSLAVWDMQGGTSTVTGEINVGWRSSEGTWNVSGNSVVTATGRLIVGAETWTPGANGGAVVSGNPVGTVNISGGSVTISGGDSRIGGDAATTNGNSASGARGTVNVTGGTLNFGGNLQIGAHGQGSMTISGSGTVNSTGGFPVVGRYPTGNGVLNIDGGTYNHTGAGTLTIIGEEGTGTLNVNSGLASVVGLRVGALATGNGTVNLNGGTLATGSILKPNGSSTAAFKLNGGTLRTTAPNADLFAAFPAGSVTVETGGAVIDTNGFDSAVSQGLVPGTPGGGLTKRGAGTLTLAGANTYTGPTVIEAGTLAVTGGISGSALIDVRSGASLDVIANGLLLASGQTLQGTGNVLGNIGFGAGAVLAPGESPGTLSVSGNLDLAPAVSLIGSGALHFELGALNNSDKVSLASGTLSIGSGVLAFDDFAFTTLAGLQEGAYTLFDGGLAINGSLDEANLSGSLGGAWTGTLAFADDGNDLVLTVVPEPGSAALILGGLAALCRRRRRGAV